MLVIAIILQASAAPIAMTPVMKAEEVYFRCVGDQAKKLAPAKEPAEAISRAAEIACRSLEPKMREITVQHYVSTGKIGGAQAADLAEDARARRRELARDNALYEVVRIRAGLPAN